MEFVLVEIRRELETLNELFTVIKDYGFVCGGFARYAVSPLSKPAQAYDIDVYPYSESSYKMLEERFKRAYGDKPLETPRTFTFENVQDLGGKKVQLIRPLHKTTLGNPLEILNAFDFSVCRAAISKSNGKFRIDVDPEFEEHENRKELVIRHIACPLGVLRRIVKYARKKYWISTPELFKVLVAWESLAPTERYVISDIVKEIAKKPEDVGVFYHRLAFID